MRAWTLGVPHRTARAEAARTSALRNQHQRPMRCAVRSGLAVLVVEFAAHLVQTRDLPAAMSAANSAHHPCGRAGSGLREGGGVEEEPVDAAHGAGEVV
ncbi:hypothetical protein, partial [Streptodolium elevatio]